MNLPKAAFFLSLRTLTYGLGFFVTALLFYLLGSQNSLVDASPWWPVYGLFANLICFLIIDEALRKENKKPIDLIAVQPKKLKKDIMLSLPFIVLSLIIAVGTSFAFGYMLYGRYPFEIMPLFSAIPIWIIIGFAVIFPIINSIVEEMTYNGYIFPRIETKLKSKSSAIVLVLLFFTLQHIFITFVPDVKYMVWRLLSFIPLLLFWILIYNRMRRLTTLIVVHWFMDLFAILSLIFTPQ